MKRTFRDVLTGIKNAEKDVDKVLAAARLQRIESGKMTDKRFEQILEFSGYVLFGIGVLLFFGMYFLCILSM